MTGRRTTRSGIQRVVATIKTKVFPPTFAVGGTVCSISSEDWHRKRFLRRHHPHVRTTKQQQRHRRRLPERQKPIEFCAYSLLLDQIAPTGSVADRGVRWYLFNDLASKSDGTSCRGDINQCRGRRPTNACKIWSPGSTPSHSSPPSNWDSGDSTVHCSVA